MQITKSDFPEIDLALRVNIGKKLENDLEVFRKTNEIKHRLGRSSILSTSLIQKRRNKKSTDKLEHFHYYENFLVNLFKDDESLKQKKPFFSQSKGLKRMYKDKRENRSKDDSNAKIKNNDYLNKSQKIQLDNLNQHQNSIHNRKASSNNLLYSSFGKIFNKDNSNGQNEHQILRLSENRIISDKKNSGKINLNSIGVINENKDIGNTNNNNNINININNNKQESDSAQLGLVTPINEEKLKKKTIFKCLPCCWKV